MEVKYAGWLLIDGILKELSPTKMTLLGLNPWAWSHASISMDKKLEIMWFLSMK